ncbi:HD domain-containing protein [Streptomyces mayteni]
MFTPITEPPAILHLLGAAAWPNTDQSRARKAATLAISVYSGHFRDQGTPYIHHPLAVVALLRVELAVTSPDTLLLGLLHDALEISPESEPLLTTHLGQYFVEHLRAMTPDHRLAQRGKRHGDEAAWRAKTARLDPELLLVRLADRIHNLRDLRNSPNINRRAQFVAALTEFYLPLAETSRSPNTQLNAARSLLRAEYERYHQHGREAHA